jgi:radical SAM protein with 4Fe4S-binding SPASM domain
MKFNENEVYIFNPDYVMQNDLSRILIFARKSANKLSIPNWKSFLHPVHAKIFSFFTFDRQLKTNILLLSIYLKRDESEVRKILFPFIENSQSIYTKFKEDKVLIPQNVIVNSNQVAGKVVFLNLNPELFDCRKVDITTRRINKGPQLLTLMLNNSCISDCVYCYADKKSFFINSLSTFRIMELIDEARSLPVQQINLMGGEVFLHPDWSIILKKLVAYNLLPQYISTKYPLTGKIIRAIQETGFVNPIQISLDAYSSDLLMKMLFVDSDYLTNVLKGIKLLDDSGLNYRINSVLTVYNSKKDVFKKLFEFISELNNIADWRITPVVNSLWIEHYLFQTIKPYSNEIESLYEYIESEIVPYSKIPILLNRSAINREFQCCTTGSKDFKGVECSALNNHLFILPDGKATICEQLYGLSQFVIGDVSVRSISEVWNSPAASKLLNLKREDIQDSSICKACELFESCFKDRNRCWVDIIKAYGKENWDYPDPRCALAPSMIYDLDYDVSQIK